MNLPRTWSRQPVEKERKEKDSSSQPGDVMPVFRHVVSCCSTDTARVHTDTHLSCSYHVHTISLALVAMMCEELSTAIGPPPFGASRENVLYDSLLNNVQSPELGVGPQRYIFPPWLIIYINLSVCSKPVKVESSRGAVTIGDGSTLGGTWGVGLGL